MSRRRLLVVVDDPRDVEGLAEELIVPVGRYLEGGDDVTDPRSLVANLCRTTKGGSQGYYVSLLAEARGQAVLPSVETSAGLLEPYARFRALQERGVATVDAAEMAVRRRAAEQPNPGDVATAAEEPPRRFSVPMLRGENGECRPARRDEYAETLVLLGTCADARFRREALAVFREWPAPILRLQLVCEDEEWKVTQVAAVPPQRLCDDERAALVAALADSTTVLRRGREAPRETVRASIAVLVDPGDPFSASSPETIDRLERVAARMNVHIARIGLGDLRRLPEYDALFIRALTGVSQPAFQFALRAEALDMPVVDDSQSIIRCGNKVFLEELLRREGVAMPRTVIATSHTPWVQVAELGLPLVVKLPEGSFSAAVHKVGSEAEYIARTREMFRKSPLIIAQEWLPTDFDWRITVMGGKLLFAARYFMARGHWQIRSEQKGTERYGRVEAVPRDEAPEAVVEAALRAARLIGDGLYGVDLKDTPDGPVVIEVNDNPNIDVGYEDGADGAAIYEDIVRWYLARLEEGEPEAEAEPGRGGDRGVEEAGLEAMRRPIEVAARNGVAGAGPSEGRGARGENQEQEQEGEQEQEEQQQDLAGRGRARTEWGLFEVAGLELEYPTVDRDLNVVSLIEPAFRVFAGRGTSDVELGAVALSNEIADHVFEVKTTEPVRSLADAEETLVEGIRRFAALLRDEFDARLMPTGMHPWFDPRRGKLWTRSGYRIYGTYARLFDVRTHGWMNVHASHLNLPFGDEAETIAMYNAAALLVPYLPAIAASSPMHDGELQPDADARLAWILQHQSRIPESCGRIVPEYVDSFADYRRSIFQPMYAALDRLPDAAAIRHEFFNARGAVLKFSRKAMEVRVLDTQECVKMDVAIAAFVRAALRVLTPRVQAWEIEPPIHEVLVEDFLACIRDGSEARVAAPHLTRAHDDDGRVPVREVLRGLLEEAREATPPDEQGYLDLVGRVIEMGSLAERIRARLLPWDQASDEEFTEAARRVYIELMDCLEANEPWVGRGI